MSRKSVCVASFCMCECEKIEAPALQRVCEVWWARLFLVGWVEVRTPRLVSSCAALVGM